MRGFPVATPDGSSAHRSVVECTVGCSRPGLRVKTGTASPKEFTDWLYQQSNVIVELTDY